jgi:hypothetical protein
MRKTSAPLWLICDPQAALRLWLAVGLLLARRLAAMSRKRPSAEATLWIAVMLAIAEGLLRWAIDRRAFRLNGISPAKARCRLMREPHTYDA